MSLLESLLALTLLLLFLSGLGSMIEMHKEEIAERKAAQSLLSTTQAMARYVETHRATLSQNATQTEGTELSTAEGLPNELAQVFLGQSTLRNSWGQSYRFSVRTQKVSDTSTDLLLVVATVGGNRGQGVESTRRFVRKIVSGSTRFLAQSTQTIERGYRLLCGQLTNDHLLRNGTDSVDLSPFTLPEISEGHLACLVTFPDIEGRARLDSADVLYRTEIPGYPELNSMETSLDMRNHHLLNVSTLNLTAQTLHPEDCGEETVGRLLIHQDHEGDTAGAYLCVKRHGRYAYQELLDTGSYVIKNFTLASSGQSIPKPTCINGEPEIWVAPIAMARQESSTPPLTAWQAYAENSSSTAWTVRLRLQSVGQSSWTYPAAELAKAQVLTLCRPIIAR